MNRLFLYIFACLSSYSAVAQNSALNNKKFLKAQSNNFNKIDPSTIKDNLNQLSILFTPNWGQFPKQIEFAGNVNGSQILIAKNEIGFRFVRNPQKPESMLWSIAFLGANEQSKIVAQNALLSKSNYLLGEKENWKTNVPNYGKIKIEEIYKNIDIVYYGNGENLKYDYHIFPGGKLSDIKMKCNNTGGLSINKNGELEIQTNWGKLIEKIPYSYQTSNEKRIGVDVKFVLYDNMTYGFEAKDNYNENLELVIDPTTLIWSTFIGGTAANSNGYLTSLGRDPAGNIYGTGFYSLNFPVTTGAYNVIYNKGCGGVFGLPPCGNAFWTFTAMDAYVFKMNSAGTSLIYSTYIGGSGDDYGYDIFVNNSGEAYVTGGTSDTSAQVQPAYRFPITAGAYDQTFNGGGVYFGDAFAFKLNAAGNNLLYSTFIGGTDIDIGRTINVNGAGEAYVAGETMSTDFPVTAGSYDLTANGGSDAFFCKLNASGTSLSYSTYLGGSSDDYAFDVAVNGANEALITGVASTGFPSTVAGYGPLGGNTDAYLLKLNPAGAGVADLVYSRIIGGSLDDIGARLILGTGNIIYVAGQTISSNFPTTAGAFQPAYGGVSDFYFLQIDIGLNNVLYSSYLGGSGSESIEMYNGGLGGSNFIGLGLLVNPNNEVLIAGGSRSTNYPVTSCAYQSVLKGQTDVVFTKISPNGSGTADLIYSTYVGGTDNDYGASVFSDFSQCKEEVLVGLTSHSNDFPTTPGSFMPVKGNGTYDQPALFRIGSVVTANFKADTVCLGSVTTFKDLTDQCGLLSPLSQWEWDFGDGGSASVQNPSHTYAVAGTYTVTLVVGCPNDTATLEIVVLNKPSPTITGTTSICSGQATTLTAGGANITPGATYLWSTGSTSSSITVSPTANTTYTVTITNVGGCSTSASQLITVSGLFPKSVIALQFFNCTNGFSMFNGFGSAGSAPLTYTWIWGDASANGAGSLAFHTYAPGTYILKLVVSNACGSDTSSYTHIVSTPPTAYFKVNSKSVCPGFNVVFTDSSYSGTPPYTYSWDFGDGNTSTNANPTHSYVLPGDYVVSMTVNDNNGCNSVRSDTIHVIENKSIVNITYSQGCPCSVVSFTGSGTSVTWNWDFGDGTTSTSQNPVHTYSIPGSYYVTLRGTDAGGCLDQEMQVITVCPNDIRPPSKSNNRWYFYTKAGISFSSGSPVAVTNGQLSSAMSAAEGGATVSDPVTGNLLFYTNGVKVWDATHTIMPNGSGLFGNTSAQQAALIVPFPGNANKYYIFTISGSSSSASFSEGYLGQEVHYSLVDMTLNGGFGDVVLAQKNILLINSAGSEALTGTVKKEATCNSAAEYWVVVSPNATCGTYNSFLINSSGVSSVPVTSVIPTLPPAFNCTMVGYTAISPNGWKLARAVLGNGSNGGTLLFDFNKNTGVISNPIGLKGMNNLAAGIRNNIWALCFSPDSRLLYTANYSSVSTPNDYSLYQYDITATNPQLTINSIYSSTNAANILSTMWIGPDNKLYIARLAGSIAVVNNPNVYGAGCSFALNGVSLAGKIGNYGLQNIVPLQLPRTDTSFAAFSANTNTCFSVAFTNQVIPPQADACSWLYKADTLSYKWDFGDGNTSTQSSPTHTYSSGGTYTVSLTVTRPFTCTANKLTKIITVSSPPVVTVTPASIAICNGLSTVLTANGASTYTWSPASGLSATTGSIVTATPGSTATYTVTGTNSAGCSNTSAVIVTVNQAISVSVTPTNVTCSGGLNGSISSIPSGGTSPYAYSWSAPGGQTSQTVTGLSAGNYSVTITDSKGCTSVSAATIISPTPLVGQFTKGTASCAGCGCKEWLMINASGGTSPYSYNWPDGYVNRYKNQLCPGSYLINIKDKNGCSVNVNLTAP